MKDTVFVGQGPSRKAWERAEAEDAATAVEACARLCLTGKAGDKIAALLGIEKLVGTPENPPPRPAAVFAARFLRANLNDRWNGKSGKGDSFDREEGKERAAALASDAFIASYVLLGAEVARAFGFRFSPLAAHERDGKRFLLLPHPSGIVRWWNDKENVEKASLALREFVS